MNTITPLTSSTSLGSATSRSSGQLPGQRNFQAGETFKATVLEATGKDLFTLDIAGTHIAAQSKALLNPGQILQLQVTTLSPQIELKIVSTTPQQFHGRSLTLIGKNIDLSNLVKSLQQTTVPSHKTAATVQEAKGNDVFILDIGGKQVDAQSSTPLSPGQILQIQQAVTSSQMEIALPEGTLTLVGDVADIANIAKTLQQAESLPGESISKATVLQAKGDNVFIIDIGGKQITAHSRTPLLPGQSLDLQGVSTLPQVRLALPPGSEQVPETVLTLTGDSTELENLVNSLQQKMPIALEDLSHTARTLLEDFSAPQHNRLSEKDGGEILKHLVDKMGLTLESMLAKGDKEGAVKTLKAALMETAHVFKDASEISKTTNQLIGTLEVYQLAQLHMENAANFIFPLPLPFLQKGYLVVEDYRQQKDKDQGSITSPMRFSLHLTMTDLGNLRIDFLQYQDGLYIRFNTDSKDKSNFVESFSKDLKEAVSNVPLLGLTFSENAADPAAELIKKIIPQGSSMLDTTV